MNRKLHLSIVIFLLIGIRIGKATDYYVATNGNDGDSGTASNPFRTFAKGVSKLHAGDTLYIRGGTYREGAVILHQGTESNPITIMAYPGEDVTIKGSKVISDWVLHSNNIYKTAWPYESQQVFVDGIPLIQTGRVADKIKGNAADNQFMIENPNDGNSPYFKTLDDLNDPDADGRFFYDKANALLYVRLIGDVSPQGHTVEASYISRIINAYYSRYVHIKNINFRHCNSSILKAGGGMIELGDYCKVENCDIQWSDMAGIETGYNKTGSQVINCVLSNNGNSGVTISATKHFLIQDCTINNNNYRHFNFLWHAGGIKAVSDSYGVLENNEIAHNYGSGVWFDYCDNGEKSIIRNNYIHDNGPKHAGIFIEVSSNFDIYNNIIDHNSRIGVDIAASDHIRFFNNEVMHTKGGIDVDLNITIDAVAGVRIERDPFNFPTTLSNNLLYNNVFYNNSDCTYDISILKNNPARGIENNLLDNNLYYNSNGTYTLRTEGVTVDNLPSWRNYGHDASGMISNPNYSSSTSGNITKNSSSPVLDAGKNIAIVTTDYYNTDRPQGTHTDIGAFEYASGAPNVSPDADAGIDQSIYEEESLMLDASNSTGQGLRYNWTEAGVQIATGVTPEASNLTFGIHNILLTVTDTNGATATDNVIITVNEAPVASENHLLLHWDFEDQNPERITDVTNNGNEPDDLRESEYVTNGKIGRGMSFNGNKWKSAKQYSATLATPDEITVMAWIYQDGAVSGTQNGGISKKDSWDLNIIAGSDNQHAKYVFIIKDGRGGQHMLTSSAEVTVGAWHHIVATYDKSALKLYFDGVVAGTTNAANYTILDDPTKALNCGGSAARGGEVLNGRMDEVKIYDIALPPDDILAHNSSTMPSATLKASLLEASKITENTTLPKRKEALDVKIYPNPTRGELNIEIYNAEEGEEATLEVLDPSGKNVYIKQKQSFNEKSIDLSYYPSGVYFLSVISKKDRIISKIVLQK